MAFNPTNEQRMAIDARGGSLLLSAAAGSGKTAVLTQRAVTHMLDKNDHIDADKLMIVTFTRAAASEMKERIIQKLTEYILDNPDDKNARRQRVLVDRAPIGTIHSLCSELLKQNFQLVGLPASFRIGDENELETMQHAAVSSVIEEAYREENSDFIALTELFSSGKSDAALDETVLSVLKFARAHPFYRRWLDEKLDIYRKFSFDEENKWADIIFKRAKGLVDDSIAEIETMLEQIYLSDEEAPYTKALTDDLITLKELQKYITAREWDECRRTAANYSPSRWTNPKKGDKQLAEERKEVRERAKKLIRETLGDKCFCCSKEEFCEDVSDLSVKVEILFDLVKKVDERIQNEKLESGVIDFTDLEQMACALLLDENGDRTAVAKNLSSRYGEVMVDEFQDVNEVQYSILTALAREDNFFCVGDVKQSIYRFRMAQPMLFLAREKNSFEYDGASFPAVLRLTGSFRTAPVVTAVINDVFTALMSEQAGDIDYDEHHCLVPLGSFLDGAFSGVELCLIEDDDADDEEAVSPEPAWIASEIAKIIAEEKISGNDGLRSVEPRDIAILLRSPKNHGADYRDALLSYGIDASVSLEAGFLESPEVTTVLNALSTIANPMRDVELLGTMSSPLFGFSDDELAAIRIKTPVGRLWTAVISMSEENEHCAGFVKEITRLRSLSSYMPPHALIGEILRLTGYDFICRSMKNGEQREANLKLLMQYAQDESAGVPTLSGFLKRVENIKLRKKDLAPASIGGGENAVTITSIHRSKGLEWPIVFIAELKKKHSLFHNDMQQPTVLHSELGFASVRRDERTKKQFVTAPLEALKTEKKREGLSEELRILYVAMTRAKEKLYLTANVKDSAKELHKAKMIAEGKTKVPYTRVLDSMCYLDWILEALSINHNLSLMVNLPAGDDALSVKVTSSPYVLTEKTEDTETNEKPAANKKLLDELMGRTRWNYPHASATKLPANMAVSELSHGMSQRYFTSHPHFMDEGKLTGAARGTAVHTFFQYCDLDNASKDAKAEVERLRANGMLTDEQAKAISLKEVGKFFESGIYKRMLSAEKVLREFRFMAPASCSELSKEFSDGEESTMLQGIADCIIIEEGGAIILDYKTDRNVTPDELEERYRMQVLLYRDMLSSVLDVPVKACALYSFSLGREIWVDFL